MRLRITIAYDGTAQPDALDRHLVHRFRNFGEDLYREFSMSGYAEISVDDIDTATSKLLVYVSAKRHLGVVSAFIKKTLEQHNLDDLYAVSRG